MTLENFLIAIYCTQTFINTVGFPLQTSERIDMASTKRSSSKKRNNAKGRNQ